MRAVKVFFFAVLVAGWWPIWQHREEVASAYTEERTPLALELNGIGAAPAVSERSVSPHALEPPGPDRAPTFAPVEEPDPAAPIVDPELTGGSVTLEGTVQLPDGTPVSGATIRIERFTVNGSAVGETVSGPDGTWQADGLKAGRLRVRAFAPNALASVEPVVIVLSTAGRAAIPLRVEAPAPSIHFDLVGPVGIAIGSEATVAVVASGELVDEEGRLVRIPLTGQPLQVAFSPPVRLLSDALVTTDEGGAARFLLVCDGGGTGESRPGLGGERTSLPLPPCLTPEALAELQAALEAEEMADSGTDLIGDGFEARDQETEVDRGTATEVEP